MFLVGFEAWTFGQMTRSKWWLEFCDGWNWISWCLEREDPLAKDFVTLKSIREL